MLGKSNEKRSFWGKIAMFYLLMYVLSACNNY